MDIPYDRRLARFMRCVGIAIVWFSCLAITEAAWAGYKLQEFLPLVTASALMTQADALGQPLGEPPVVPLLEKGKPVGFAFLNSDFVNATGYSGKPIHMLVAVDMAGIVQTVKLVKHHEPIVLIGIPEKRIVKVLDGYVGRDVVALAKGEAGERQVDAVTGATVTIMVMDDTILRSAIKVARAHGLGGLAHERIVRGPRKSLNMAISQVEDWTTLIADGAVRRLKLSIADVNQAYERTGDAMAVALPEQGAPDAVYIELYAAVVSIPSIGRSLLGEAEYQNLVKRLRPGDQAILLAGDGRYSFKGSGYVRGGIFDRFQVMQGDVALRFHDRQHKRLRRLAADGAPDLRDVDLFVVPAGSGFEAAQPWQLELLVAREVAALKKSFLTFKLDYQPPEKYLLTEAVSQVPAGDEMFGSHVGSADQPLWQKMWRTKLPEIVILALALVVLTFTFFFQNWVVHRPRLTRFLRIGFLLFTLFGIGFYANAQLSVVNILAVFNALVSGFDWSYFLMEPLIFLLWGATAAALLFWGRGAYCGWLCPFGALQELINQLARKLGIRQLRMPWTVHERLWAVKYIIFLVLFGFSLHSLEWAERLAEVEPFKTSIILKFDRAWPYVLFAVGMLLPSLFIERFYCRYLCPLGAALAIPARLRMFPWLKRYKECGTSCQVCAKECGVQAIHPEGDINVNECMYCLDCQVTYSDDHKCPVRVKFRHKMERREVALKAVRESKGIDVGSKST